MIGMDTNRRKHRVVLPRELHCEPARFEVPANTDQGAQTGTLGAGQDCRPITIEVRVLQVGVGVDQAWVIGRRHSSMLANECPANTRVNSPLGVSCWKRSTSSETEPRTICSNFLVSSRPAAMARSPRTA